MKSFPNLIKSHYQHDRKFYKIPNRFTLKLGFSSMPNIKTKTNGMYMHYTHTHKQTHTLTHTHIYIYICHISYIIYLIYIYQSNVKIYIFSNISESF